MDSTQPPQRNEIEGQEVAGGWRAFGRPRAVAVALLLVAVTGVAGLTIGESLGWPFLAGPLQRLLSRALEREVQFGAVADAGADAPANGFRLRFIGGVLLQAPRIEIAAPSWSTAPYLLRASDVSLELRYADLWRRWRAGPEQPLRIQRLQAAQLDANLERRADGSASWSFAAHAPTTAPPPIPSFGSLQVGAGTLQVRDALLALDVKAQLALADAAGPGSTLQAQASGRYRDMPLQAELSASGAMPWTADEAHATPVPLRLKASIGRARFAFDGSALDALRLRGLSGRFTLSGPSLAAVGDPLGVTLPTTAPFRSEGTVAQQGNLWRVKIDSATIGGSRLDGDFRYDTGSGVPLLAGRLGGRRLLLADLGPVIGTTPIVEASAPATLKPAQAPGKVLPARPFDLAALRAMNADVLIDIPEVDLNTRHLEPLQPLRGHLVLAGGVLTLSDLDARTAQGELHGTLRLDGQGARALWQADLRWNGVRLEHWVRQARAAGQPPYVTGRLDGSATLSGQGRSTAEILASLKGRARTELNGGTVSHLAIEAAGLDLAESLGVLMKGDDALTVNCAVADLVVDAGVFRPRVMVLDSTDSAVWVDGSLSLATEVMDLRAVVSPKDFSPLALRTPLQLRGSFAKPQLSLEKGPMGLKLGAAFLLALVNPLAALIPLVDTGSAGDAERDTAGCQALNLRHGARPAKAASR